VHFTRTLPPELEAERKRLTTEDAFLALQGQLVACIPDDVDAQALHEEDVYVYLSRLSKLLETVHRGVGNHVN
jgi:hypothetical protein